MYKQIGILTGGGDAPGLNAAIRAVVRTAVGEFGMNVVGVEDSFEGILGETHTRKLTTKSVSGILPRGGTILGTRNRGHFVKTVNGRQVFAELCEIVEEMIELYHEDGKPLPPPTSGRDFANTLQNVAGP